MVTREFVSLQCLFITLIEWLMNFVTGESKAKLLQVRLHPGGAVLNLDCGSETIHEQQNAVGGDDQFLLALVYFLFQ